MFNIACGLQCLSDALGETHQHDLCSHLKENLHKTKHHRGQQQHAQRVEDKQNVVDNGLVQRLQTQYWLVCVSWLVCGSSSGSIHSMHAMHAMSHAMGHAMGIAVPKWLDVHRVLCHHSCYLLGCGSWLIRGSSSCSVYSVHAIARVMGHAVGTATATWLDVHRGCATIFVTCWVVAAGWWVSAAAAAFTACMLLRV